jgi:hypothetical protein
LGGCRVGAGEAYDPIASCEPGVGDRSAHEARRAGHEHGQFAGCSETAYAMLIHSVRTYCSNIAYGLH